MMPFILKNISYEHEKEVRALIVAPLSQIPREGFDLPLNLNDFVDEIVVNPFCQTWFTKAVAGLTDRYDLKSKLGKSSLSPEVLAREYGGYGFRARRYAVLRCLETKGFLVRFHTQFHTFSADFVCLGVTYYVPLTRSPAIL
jgi:hypothetical protein